MALATPLGSAEAQVNAQLTDLHSEALELYQNLDIDNARGKLLQAVDIAHRSGYVGPELTQVYMTLGVVHVAGAQDFDQGLAAFMSALCMQPDVQLDPLLSTPDAQQVFGQAQQDARSGGCGPGGPQVVAPPPTAQPLMPTYVPQSGPQVVDEECPPGVVCGPGGEREDPADNTFARWFVGLQLALGAALVQSGMGADSKPPFDEIFTEEPFLLDVNNDGMINDLDDSNMDGMIDAETRYYFDDQSAWVPDADSYDDYEDTSLNIPRATTPVSAKCKADGTETGPPGVLDDQGNPLFATIEPSSYCARVETPGMVPSLAIRLTPGYFLSNSFALSLPVRIAFSAGEGSFSRLLIGLRGELLFSEMTEATGFPVSWFFGATYGQIQVKPPPKNTARPAPYVVSGPIGVHTGVNIRLRLHRNVGILISPEIDVLFPDLLFAGDFSIGAEGAF